MAKVCDKCSIDMTILNQTFVVGQHYGSLTVELCGDCFKPFYRLLAKNEIAPKGLELCLLGQAEY